MADICILSHLHVSSNPRVWKEANAFAEKGYKVTILTNWTSVQKLKEDQPFIQNPNISYKVVMNLVPGNGSLILRNLSKIKRKSLELLKIVIGWEHPDMINFNTRKFLKAAVKENAAIYIGHLEGGLIIGAKLLKYKKKVAFDIEDWYSKDFINKSRPVKLLEKYEQIALQKGMYLSCPSDSMAKAIGDYYNSVTKIHTVYNGFSLEENKTVETKQRYSKPRLVWFSQTVGKGRGLETLFEALQMVPTPVHLTLIGNCSKEYNDFIVSQFSFEQGHTLQIIPPVPHSKLLNLIANNDIGLAIENITPESRNTTITNKILQYLQANLQVIATATKGQAEVAGKAGDAVQLVTVNDPKQWSAKIDEMISRLHENTKPLSVFTENYSWELQEKKLFKIIEQILS